MCVCARACVHLYMRMYVYVCVCMCVHVCVRARVRACVPGAAEEHHVAVGCLHNRGVTQRARQRAPRQRPRQPAAGRGRGGVACFEEGPPGRGEVGADERPAVQPLGESRNRHCSA